MPKLSQKCKQTSQMEAVETTWSYPYKGHFEKSGQKWQRQQEIIAVLPEKTFCHKKAVKTCKM